jgi:hypothetical protein
VLLLVALPAFILIVNLENSARHPTTLLFYAVWFSCGFTAFWFARRKCIVGLTDRRFIVISFRTDPSKGKVLEYSLASLPPVETVKATDDNFVTIAIGDPRNFFIGSFHKENVPNNRTHFLAIANNLNQRQTPQAQTRKTLGI